MVLLIYFTSNLEPYFDSKIFLHFTTIYLPISSLHYILPILSVLMIIYAILLFSASTNSMLLVFFIFFACSFFSLEPLITSLNISILSFYVLFFCLIFLYLLCYSLYLFLASTLLVPSLPSMFVSDVY